MGSQIPNPCYVLEVDKLRSNLEKIEYVRKSSGVTILLAFKAFAFWPVLNIVREKFGVATASSLNEVMLANTYMLSKPHTYAPVYSPEDIDEIIERSSHLTFNSLGLIERYREKIRQSRNKDLSVGLRVNPELSQVETDLYNPCLPGSRLGVPADELPEELPEEIEGFHVHALCESSAAETASLLGQIEKKFGRWLGKLKWLNIGGGHLMTRAGYDTEGLIEALRAFRSRHQNLELILEPGSAFGYLTSRVEDIVEHGGVKTAMLNVSFACHMPDCLEMPYKPVIRGAHHEPVAGLPTYRMGGCSCLSGDYVGEWSFDK